MPTRQDERLQWLSRVVGLGAYARALNWARSIPVLDSAVEWMKPACTSEAARTEDYQEFAGERQQLWWQHEFEADEVACALLARLRLPPEQWAAGLRVIARSVMWHEQRHLRMLLEMQQQLGPDEKRQIAMADGFPNGDFDAGVALLQAALAAGDADAIQRLRLHTILPFSVLKSVCPQRNLRYRPPRGSLGLREKQ